MSSIRGYQLPHEDIACPCENCLAEEIRKVEVYRTDEAFLKLCFPEETGGEG